MSTAKTLRQKRTSNINKPFQFQQMATFERVTFTKDKVNFYLSNDTVVALPLNLLPKLEKATKKQRQNYEINGHFIFWDDVDEAIGVKNLFNGSIQYRRNTGK